MISFAEHPTFTSICGQALRDLTTFFPNKVFGRLKNSESFIESYLANHLRRADRAGLREDWLHEAGHGYGGYGQD